MAKDWIFITNIPNSAKPRSVSIEERRWCSEMGVRIKILG